MVNMADNIMKLDDELITDNYRKGFICILETYYQRGVNDED